MNRTQALRWLVALGAAAVFAAAGARGQKPEPQESSSKRPLEEGETRPKASAIKPAAPVQPKFDPLRAEKDIEVGRYYMRKGDADAAITRFQDAIEARPNYALPYLLLGGAQEKKGLRRQAIQSYTRYLEVFPHAEDAQKVRRRIEKLKAAMEKRRGKGE